MPALPENHVYLLSRTEWRAWLEAHHTREDGVWVVLYKRATGKPTVAMRDLVEEAICWGWIDSSKRGIDDERSIQYVSPRRPGSSWSRVNKGIVERMEASGAMTDAGRAKIGDAKTDGSWTRLDDVENLVVPDDLAEAFGRHPGSHEHWDAFPRTPRRGILEWILNAKRPATRQKRVEETARLAAENERANQWSRGG